ncbi:hypothetical protein CSIM01_06759 [Colletotrichum simmondsii]|uniref:Uncharacterized protein n=1 Tax=Colletotrichum simmondsii TaxID=703756 RepID=A0A135RVW4_9PEZI|nr:hypothetical protein CSIM01_06759 [Colletotrichum simmondsii]
MDLNCTAPEGPLNASGDIVGYGPAPPQILAAFMGTTTIMMAAVILAYFFDGVDDEVLNDLDRKIISSVTWNKSRKKSGSNQFEDERERQRLRQRRSKAFSQFILALSDQQLITGLAILIAVISGTGSLSQFEFSTAHSLAWFSSTTHLATLDILRQKLKSQNQWVFHVRVFGMVCFLVLLTYTTAVIADMDRNHKGKATAPAACLSSSDGAGILVSQEGLPLLLLWSGYISRLQNLYLKERGIAPLLDLVYSRLALLLAKEKASLAEMVQGEAASYPKSESTAFSLSFKMLQEKAAAHRKSEALLNARSRLEEHRPGPIYNLVAKVFGDGEMTSFLAGFRLLDLGARRSIAGTRYSSSLLSTSPKLIFTFGFGVSQIVLRRFLKSPDLTPESIEMGFGQIVALFLLLQPLMAVGDVYTGEALPLAAAQYKSGGTAGPLDSTMHQCQTSGNDADPSSVEPCNYVTHFDEIKQYLYTTASDPNMVPQELQEDMYKLFLELKETENRFGFGPSILLYIVDILLSIPLGPLLVPFESYDAERLPLVILGTIWMTLKTRRTMAAMLVVIETFSPVRRGPCKSEETFLWTESVLLLADEEASNNAASLAGNQEGVEMEEIDLR